MIESLKSKRPEAEIIYIGSGKIEKDFAKKKGIAFYEVRVKGMPRKPSFQFLEFLCYLFISSLRALQIIRREKVDAVFATGGYVSFPSCFAAVLLRKPLFLHEQNATPGLVNRIFLKYAEVFFQSFPVSDRSSRFANQVHSGNPVRKEILKWTRTEGAAFLGLDPRKKTIFVFGGSQGSKKINETLLETLRLLDQEIEAAGIQVIHAFGKRDYQEKNHLAKSLKNELENIDYIFFDYLDEIGAAYAASDLVVCRAGATTIAELIATGKPSILIPYPYATENHQMKNAQVVAGYKAAIIIRDDELNAYTLKKAILDLVNDDSRLQDMSSRLKKMRKTDAASEIASHIISALEKS